MRSHDRVSIPSMSYSMQEGNAMYLATRNQSKGVCIDIVVIAFMQCVYGTNVYMQYSIG